MSIKPFIPKKSGGVYLLASDPTKCFLLVGTRTKTDVFYGRSQGCQMDVRKKIGVSYICCEYDPNMDFSNMTLEDFITLSLKEHVTDWHGHKAYWVKDRVPKATALLHEFEIPATLEFLFRHDQNWNDSMPFDDTHHWQQVNLIRIVNLEIPTDSNKEVIPDGSNVGVIGKDEELEVETVIIGVKKGFRVYTMQGTRALKGALLLADLTPTQLEIRQKIIELYNLKF